MDVSFIQSQQVIELHKVPQGMRIDANAPFRNIEEDEDRVTPKVECLLYREGIREIGVKVPDSRPFQPTRTGDTAP